MCLAIHTTNISQFAATFNDARNQEIHRSCSCMLDVYHQLSTHIREYMLGVYIRIGVCVCMMHIHVSDIN